MSMNLRQTKKAMPPNSYSKKNQTQKDSKDDDKISLSNENLSEIHSNQVSNSSIDIDGRGRLNKRNNPNNFKGRYSKMNSGKYLYKDNNKTDKKPVINKKKHLKYFNNEFVNTLKKFLNKLFRKEAMLNKKRNRESMKDSKINSMGENYYYTNLNLSYDPMAKKGRNMPPIQTPYQNQNYGYHPQNLHFYPDFLNSKNPMESNQMLMRMNSATNKGDYYLPKTQEYFHIPYQNMNLSHSTPNLMSNAISQQQQQNMSLEMKNYNMPLEEESKKQKDSVSQSLEKESIKSGPIDYTGINHIFAAFYIKSMQKLKSEQASLNSNHNLSRENSKKNSSLNINNNNATNNFGTSNSNQKTFKKEISEFNNELHGMNQTSNISNPYSNTEEKKQRGDKNSNNNYNNNLSANNNYNPYSSANSLNNTINNLCNNFNNISNANPAGGNYKIKIFNLLKVPEKANMIKKNGIANNSNDNSNSNSMGPLTTSLNLNSLEDIKGSNTEVKIKERQNSNSSITHNSSSKGENQHPEVLFTFNKVGTPEQKNKSSKNPNANNNLSSSPNSNSNSFSGNKDNHPDENLNPNNNLIKNDENKEKSFGYVLKENNTNQNNNENENTEPKNIENSDSKSSSENKNRSGADEVQEKKENENIHSSADKTENKGSDKEKEMCNPIKNIENNLTNEKQQKENENTKLNLSNHPIKTLNYPNSFGLVDLPTNFQLKQVDDVLKKMKENK